MHQIFINPCHIIHLICISGQTRSPGLSSTCKHVQCMNNVCIGLYVATEDLTWCRGWRPTCTLHNPYVCQRDDEMNSTNPLEIKTIYELSNSFIILFLQHFISVAVKNPPEMGSTECPHVIPPEIGSNCSYKNGSARIRT